jgi:hypothetical protein
LESQITKYTEELATMINRFEQCKTELETEKCRHDEIVAQLVAEAKDLKESVEQLLSGWTRCPPLTADETNTCAPLASAFAIASSSPPSTFLDSPPAPEDHSEKNRSLSPIMASSDEGAESKEGRGGQSLEAEFREADVSYGSDMDDIVEAHSTDSEMHETSDDLRETMTSHKGSQEPSEMDIDAPEYLKSSLSSRKPKGSQRPRNGIAMSERLAKNPLRQDLPPQANGNFYKLNEHRKRRVGLKLKKNQPPKARGNSEQVQLPNEILKSQRTDVD